MLLQILISIVGICLCSYIYNEHQICRGNKTCVHIFENFLLTSHWKVKCAFHIMWQFKTISGNSLEAGFTSESFTHLLGVRRAPSAFCNIYPEICFVLFRARAWIFQAVLLKIYTEIKGCYYIRICLSNINVI